MSAPLCAVDRDGNRYTDASSASRGEWWYGATILTNGVMASLDSAGLLPLTEVTPTQPPTTDESDGE